MRFFPDKIGSTEVPSVVKSAADKAVPGAKWTGVDVTYELEGTDAKGRPVTVEVESDGEVIEVETEITEKEVPQLVTKAFRAKYPRFTINSVHEIKSEGKVSSYQFEGRRVSDKEDVTVMVSPDGKNIDLID